VPQELQASPDEVDACPEQEEQSDHQDATGAEEAETGETPVATMCGDVVHDDLPERSACVRS
jgi:hypothetical protein